MEKYDDYGVPRDVSAKFEWASLYFADLSVLVAGGFTIMLSNGHFPKSEFAGMIIFDIAAALFFIFMIIPANGDKRNYNIILLYIQKKVARHKRHYRALTNTQEITSDADY